MPVNFHIGSSASDMDWFGKVPWPSFNGEQKLSVGRPICSWATPKVIGNLIFCGVPERFPEVKFVSVESGVGWIPFFLEALDYQLYETGPTLRDKLSMLPSEYFQRQFYGCFWFESLALQPAVRRAGRRQRDVRDRLPPPTCLYPKSDERVRRPSTDSTSPRGKRLLRTTPPGSTTSSSTDLTPIGQPVPSRLFLASQAASLGLAAW